MEVQQDKTSLESSIMDMNGNHGADFLSFRIADELYGVEICSVEEIRVWETPTPIPKAPFYIKGVINLRGMIVPIMDLRLRFMVPKAEYLVTTVVLVLKTSSGNGERLMGVVVDAVSDVVSSTNQEKTSVIGETAVTQFIDGLFNVQDQVMSLLNVDELLNFDHIFQSEAG